MFSGSLINWVSDTINVALVSGAYAPSQDSDQFWSTPQSFEITGTGYTAGGQTLTGKSVGSPVGNHTIPLLASQTNWTGASFSCSYAIIYKSTGTASTSPLLGYVNFGSTETVASGTFGLAWDPTYGVLSVTVS